MSFRPSRDEVLLAPEPTLPALTTGVADMYRRGTSYRRSVVPWCKQGGTESTGPVPKVVYSTVDTVEESESEPSVGSSEPDRG